MSFLGFCLAHRLPRARVGYIIHMADSQDPSSVSFQLLAGNKRVRLVLFTLLGTALVAGACGGATSPTDGDEGSSTGSSTTESSSSGSSGETSTTTGASGEGSSGETTTGDGDGTGGDGNATSGSESGGGSGDGDGEPESCQSDDDCVAVWETSATCYSGSCGSPVAVTVGEAASDECLVEFVPGTPGPQASNECMFMGEIACTLECAVPPTCASATCNASGACELEMGFSVQECAEEVDACAALEKVFQQAVGAARACLAGGITPSSECDAGESVQDLCGCPIAVSSEAALGLPTIEAARLAYLAQCDQPDFCSAVDCVQKTDSGTCELTTHPDGMCVFD